MRINAIMSHPVATIAAAAKLSEVAQLMWDHDCGAIPVVDLSGKMTGIVTDRDICMAAFTKGMPIHAIVVADIMTKDVLSCRPTESIKIAGRLMRDGQVRRIPVVDDEGRPIGIVSLSDLASAAARTKKRSPDRLLVQTLAAVCQRGPDRTEGRPHSLLATVF